MDSEQTDASRRRDRALARSRRLAGWIAGGAVGATVVLGAAFAQADSGHGSSPAPSGPSQSTSTTPTTSSGSDGAGGSGDQSGITAPPQAPAQTFSQPQVRSGGS
jgi:hypothetical protein